MACLATTGRNKVCRSTVGGLRAVYLGNGVDFATGIATTDGVVTTLPEATVYKYDLESQHGHGSLTQPAQISPENHTVFYQPAVMMMLPHLTGADQRELSDVTASNSLYVFAEDNQGNVWMLENAQVTALDAPSGQNMGDFNGYNITFTANMKYLPYVLLGSSTAFAAFPNITVIDGTPNS